MNAAVGVATALAMWVTGVGEPLLWAQWHLCLNYVPILGAAAGALIFLFVGLLTLDTLWQALLPAGLYLVIHIVEGETITPMLLGKTVHPQPRPRHHLARLLVLDVGHTRRHPFGANAGDHEDNLRPCPAVDSVWSLSRAVNSPAPAPQRRGTCAAALRFWFGRARVLTEGRRVREVTGARSRSGKPAEASAEHSFGHLPFRSNSVRRRVSTGGASHFVQILRQARFPEQRSASPTDNSETVKSSAVTMPLVDDTAALSYHPLPY